MQCINVLLQILKLDRKRTAQLTKTVKRTKLLWTGIASVWSHLNMNRQVKVDDNINRRRISYQKTHKYQNVYEWVSYTIDFGIFKSVILIEFLIRIVHSGERHFVYISHGID